ncbi:MAG: ornithine carbamoyltransferase [Chrysothrix sp. TS-e1954]|nr:MAG: ornithine carbamoyltransferase [Chrysothrix sp. TS-e1954]
MKRLLVHPKPSILPRSPSTRLYSSTASPATPPTSPFAPRHLLSIADLHPHELTTLIRNAFLHKQRLKTGSNPLPTALSNRTIALLFTKRSTRTRVSTESAVASMGGHPLFLGANDVQLGVNESLLDTAKIVSSMTAGIVARVDAHEDVRELARHSSVPVVNALSDAFHPMQTIADFLTVYEAFHARTNAPGVTREGGLGLDGLKIAWVGDANNVLFDLAIGAAKLNVDLAVATPRGHEIPGGMRQVIQAASEDTTASLKETNVPEEAVKGADVIVTDTWISMGQEAEKAERLKAFAGFQVTAEMARRGGAKEDWKFMHCLPRHPEEVDDAVFYSPKSLVFQEGENRLYAAVSALEAFVVNAGKVQEVGS